MKKCEYCAKELESYHLQYCKDSDCEEKAISFYEKRQHREKVFGIINIITIIGIMAGLFLSMFTPNLGNVIVSISTLIMATAVMIMPYAPESFYEKYRIKKTTTLVRIFGVFLYAFSVLFACFAVYRTFF